MTPSLKWRRTGLMNALLPLAGPLVVGDAQALQKDCYGNPLPHLQPSRRSAVFRRTATPLKDITPSWGKSYLLAV